MEMLYSKHLKTVIKPTVLNTFRIVNKDSKNGYISNRRIIISSHVLRGFPTLLFTSNKNNAKQKPVSTTLCAEFKVRVYLTTLNGLTTTKFIFLFDFPKTGNVNSL